jgi:hypothetical protein
VSVQSSHASIQRGQNATYVVAVSAKNGSAADVSVTITADPATEKPTFISGCTTGDKTATCTVSSVTDAKAVDLDAQIPVSSHATSAVKLTATASIVTTATWTAPSAASTVTVTSASASPSPTKTATSAPPQSALPVGPLPSLNGESSSLMGAGNAAGLFPAISPSATPSPSPSAGVHARETRRNAESVADSSTITPVLTAQIAGLIALAAALLLTLTRLSLRKFFRFGK